MTYIYQRISQGRFVQMFDDYSRADNFSIEAREALYDFFEELAESCGEPFEMDVIVICCDFTEYRDFAELQDDYSSIVTMQDLEDNTTVIHLSDDSFIIQQF